MEFRVNVKSTVAMRMPGFNDDQMRRFGERAIELQQERVLAGVNVLDAPARPLSAGYEHQKSRRGLPPIRNMRLTGAMLASMHVTSVGHGKVREGFTPAENLKAHVNQEREEMFGLSPRNRAELRKEMAAEYGDMLRETSGR